MAALPAGVQYGLSSESSYKENKDLVFVKLTDSAIKAIEDFIRNNKGKFGATPTIEFLPGNEGKITIPAGNGVQQPPATFLFSLSNNAEMEGPQGSFECVRGGALGSRRLDACGQLTRRMRVHANDDSYENTKHRMARTVAEEQSKCTRVIKPNQTEIGRRVKRTSNSTPSSGNNRNSSDRATLPNTAVGGVTTVPLAQPPHPVRTEYTKRPTIRERLIQLLALKPFKKPEIYSRLTNEGINEKEKIIINTILQQISSIKDNCYHLHRHVWNDVNEDWPFYTEDEKIQLKRRKPQNLTPPLSSDSSQSLSPRASPGKRSANADSDASLPSKKQRISHYSGGSRKPRAATPSSGYATGASSGERHLSDTEDGPVKKDNGYTLSYATAPMQFSPSPDPPTPPPAPKQTAPETAIPAVTVTAPIPSSPPRPAALSLQRNDFSDNNDTTALKECLENNMNSQLEWLDSNIDEVEREWPAIRSERERRAYKAEFAREYGEYRLVYGRVARTASRFAHLERKLSKLPPQSPDHEKLTKAVMNEYKRARQDPAYCRDRRRCHQLHLKLQLIKERVAQYDDKKSNLKNERASGVQAY